MNRRNFVKTSAGAALVAASSSSASGTASAAAGDDTAIDDTATQEWQQPVFDLHKKITSPVKIASIDLLQSGKQFFVRTRSTDGAGGMIRTKNMENFIPILQRRVIPAFLNKDARDIETLVDDVYIANYKLSGQAFWCPVAYVEQSLLDLMG